MFRKLIPILFLCVSVGHAGLINRTSSNKTTGDALTADEYNSDIDVLYNEINGSLNSANLATNAVTSDEITADSVIPSKVDEDNTSPFVFKDITVTAGITASTATFTSTMTATAVTITNATLLTIDNSPTFTYGWSSSTGTVGTLTITNGFTASTATITTIEGEPIFVSTPTFNADMHLAAGSTFYLDGGGDTGIQEVTANSVQMRVGGESIWQANADGFRVLKSTAGITLAGNEVTPANTIGGWVKFNGTGTLSIYDSYNVATVADNNTGDYTVTWDLDFADANYAYVGMANQPEVANTVQASGSVNVTTATSAGGAADAARVSVVGIGVQ